MMNRFIVIILLSMSLFFSCDIKLANDLYKDLYNDSTTKINFYSDKEENLPEGQTPLIYSCSYKIGNKITISELPDYKNSELAKWSNIKRVVGWKYYRWTESKALIDDDRLITSIDISLNEIDLYAVYHTQYKVIYNFQNEDLSTYQKKEYIYYGESGSTVTITPDEEIPMGYELKSSSSSTIDLTINIDGSSYAEFIFDRKSITITLDSCGGAFSNGETTKEITGSYGTSILSTDIENPTKSDNVFLRWNPEIPSKFPAENLTYYAIYKGQEFNINYKDWNGAYGATEGKDFSGDISNLPSSYESGVGCEIPIPQLSTANIGSAQFKGWYTDVGCTIELNKNSNGNYIISETSSSNINLFAKWEYNWIYVDPQDISSMANDTNTGISSNCPVKTISTALNYKGKYNFEIRVMSTISSIMDRSYLKDIYTDEYNYCILKNVNSDSNLSLIMVDIDSNSDFDFGNLKIYDDVSTYVIKVIKGKLIVNGLTFENEVDDKLSIYLENSATAYLEDNLRDDVCIKIFSPDWQSFPQVLSEKSTGYINSNYTKFESMHDGFEIDQEGRLVTPSSIEINPETPSITNIVLGELKSTTSYLIDSTNMLTFNVLDDAYNNIKEDSDIKKIKWTLSEDPYKTGESQITGSAGSYKAELDVTDLSLGMHSIIISAESSSSDVVLESMEYVISVVK